MFLALSSASGQMISSHAPTLPPAKASAAPAQKGGFVVTGKPVVRVNGKELTDRDLLREMFDLFPYARLHNGFPKDQEPAIRQGAMQMIIFEELVYQEALRRNVPIAPERVNREVTKFRRQFGSQAEYDDYLKTEMGGSAAKLRSQIKRSLLIEAMLKTEVDSKSVVPATEARLYYTKNPQKFEHGEMFAIQTISILPPPKANPETLQEARKHAEAVYSQAKTTKSYKDFGLIAEKESDDDYHVDMGDHKAVAREKLPPEIVNAVLAMKPGDVSGLLQLGTAYTIVRLNAHLPAGKLTFAEVKAKLITNLQKQKFENLRVALGKRLRQNAKVQEL
jgi:parvulin-like peptidyl-prolyl isomerase